MGSVDQAVIRETAAALRHTCDRILNDGADLTLPAAALRVLHAHFSALFPAAVRGEFAPAAGSSLVATAALYDLQFLRDLAQLTAGLRVTAAAGPEEGPVPLGDFSRLERLQLVSVPVCWVHGLQARRPYLRALSCDAAVGSLAELLADCGGDQSSPFLWEELTELCVTRCRLPEVERDALRLAPHLTLLDLSHNLLPSGAGLDCLAGLQRLNMAANLLTAVPALSMPSHLALRWLCLRANKLETIDGVEEMLALEHLDVSYNLLLSHTVLRPLLELGRLRSLLLSGNPLTCLSDHRRRTAEQLHHNCHTGQMMLDGRRLLSSEVPRSGDPPAARTALRPSPSSGSGTVPATPPRPRLSRQPSLSGRRTRPVGPSTASSGPAEKGSGGGTPRPQRRRSTKRRSRVNVADISDMDSTTSLNGALTASLDGVAEATPAVEQEELPSYLVTRDRIESLRQQMGADWLHSGGGARVQELLGLPAQPPPTFSVGSVPIESPASRAMNGTSSAGATPAGTARRSPSGTDQPPPPVTDASAAAGPSSEPSLYPSREATLAWEHHSAEEEEEEEEEEDVACLVVARRLLRPGLEEDVMLTVTVTAVKEKELDAGRTVAEWDVRSVEACHVTKMEPLTVQLNFDTVRKEKRERNYVMEQSEWEELSAALSPIIEARLASELAASALQCIKCAAEFSDALAKTTAVDEDVKAGRTKHVQTCPNCGSNMIIRAEKVSHPNAEVARSPGMLAKTTPKKPPLKKRLSNKKLVSSTPRLVAEQQAAAAPFLGTSPVTDDPELDSQTSNTTKPETHTDSSVSVVTPEPEPEPVPAAVRSHANGPPERADSRTKYDSDVEVISNPSESSIDVILDSTARSGGADPVSSRPATEGGETAGGHQTATAGGQESAVGGGPSWPPMEESSSSGSMTASVCTVRDKRGTTIAAAPPPPPPAAAPDTADLSCTLTPEPVNADTLDSSAISSIDTSAIFPTDTSATSPPNGGSSGTGGVWGASSEVLLDSWLRGGGGESESESDSVEEAGEARLRFWHGDLTRLDHRLQLHLDMNVLQAEEQVVFVAKCTCAFEPQYQQQECVLVVSSETLYFLEITGDDSGQLERWLRPLLTRPVTEVFTVGALLHCHGLGLQLAGREPSVTSQLMLITRDASRGRRLFRHLTESCTEATETDRWLVSQRLQVEHMLSGDAGADLSLQQLLFVQLLDDHSYNSSDSTDSGSSASVASVAVMLCMTPSDLLLMECDLRWLVPGQEDVKIPMRDREKVANIVGLELLQSAAAGRPGLRLLFRDAGSGSEHSWRLAASSRAAVADLVASLQQPWAAAARPQVTVG